MNMEQNTAHIAGKHLPNMEPVAGCSDGSILKTGDLKPSTSDVIQPPPPECRRSSRKKIIKFDVRDLLNKNRKPHKIQIEARIDSNAPTTSRTGSSLAKGEPTIKTTSLSASSSQDLSSKQKVFMEKSAIFRRFSISQDQPKHPPPPPLPLPPTILGKAGDKINETDSVIVSGKRLNRSQEYYKNSLIKSLPATSLIVAQVESNTRTVDGVIQTKRTVGVSPKQTTSKNTEPPLPPKKRGRPPKIRLTEVEKKNTKQADSLTLSPEKAKNWKEYKACLAEQNNVKHENLPVSKKHQILDITKEKSSDTTAGVIIHNLKQSDKTTTELSVATNLKIGENISDVHLNLVCEGKQTHLNDFTLPSYCLKVNQQKDLNIKAITSVCNEIELCFNEESKGPIIEKDARDNTKDEEKNKLYIDEKGAKVTGTESPLVSKNSSLSQNSDSKTSLIASCSDSPAPSRDHHSTALCKQISKENSTLLAETNTATSCASTQNFNNTPSESSDHKINFIHDNTPSESSDHKINSINDVNTLQVIEKPYDASTENSSSDSLSLAETSDLNKGIEENDDNNVRNLNAFKSQTNMYSKPRKSLRKRNEKGRQNIEKGTETQIKRNFQKSYNPSDDSSSNHEVDKLEGHTPNTNVNCNELCTFKNSEQTATVRKSLRKQRVFVKNTSPENNAIDSEDKSTTTNQIVSSKSRKDVRETPSQNSLELESKKDIGSTLQNVDEKKTENYTVQVSSLTPTPSVKGIIEVKETTAYDENVCLNNFSKEQSAKSQRIFSEKPSCKNENILDKLNKNEKEETRNSDDNNLYPSNFTSVETNSLQSPFNDGAPCALNKQIFVCLENSNQTLQRQSNCLEGLCGEGNTSQENKIVYNSTAVKNIEQELKIEDKRKSLEKNDQNKKIEENDDCLKHFDVKTILEVETVESVPSQLESRERQCFNDPSKELAIIFHQQLPPTNLRSGEDIQQKIYKRKQIDSFICPTKNKTNDNPHTSKENLTTLENKSEISPSSEKITKTDDFHGLGLGANENAETKSKADELRSESSGHKNDIDGSEVLRKICKSTQRNSSLFNEDDKPEIPNDVKLSPKVKENSPKVTSECEHLIVDIETEKTCASDAKKFASVQANPGTKNELIKNCRRVHENVTITEKLDGNHCQSSIEQSKTNIDLVPDSDSTNSYVIKNLSIETNTLLDILRTVQCNEEAAVEAKKACETLFGGTKDPEIPSNASSTKNIMSQKKLIGSCSNSPCRSTSASPLTIKKAAASSPCRSDTSSPSIMKKIYSPSPSRSDSSSPLSLNKKITRRYERRAAVRGEETSHKTLEETFAEIAALSSKAVLEMSNKDKDIEVEETSINADDKSITIINQDYECAVRDTTYDVGELESRKEETMQQFEISLMKDMPTYKEEGIQCEKDSEALSLSNDLLGESDKSDPINNTNKTTEFSIDEQKNTKLEDTLIIYNNDGRNTENRYQFNESVGFSSDLLPQPQPVNEQNMIERTSSAFRAGENANTVTREGGKGLPSKINPLKTDAKANKIECKSSNKKSSKKIKSFECNEFAKFRILENISSPTTTPPPTKRGRKPKVKSSVQSNTPSPLLVTNSGGGKKNSKKEQKVVEEKQKVINYDEATDDSIDEKIAKKKRQRKLKEAFEAALADQSVVKCFDTASSSSSSFDSNFKSRLGSQADLEITKSDNTSSNERKSNTPPETDEPDPLKDIEKFIEDGVNLLKKGYKMDEDSVDSTDLIQTKTTVEENEKLSNDHQEYEILSTKEITVSFETPADTPIATPSVTPPPKSPESSSCQSEQNAGGVRRSHRLKLNSKTPKALVGRGLVRDKERFSIKDDVETKSHYTLDDHLLDLAEVEAKNAKFLKEMEERLSNFQVIKENEYKCERVISREARKMICDCFLTAEEEGRGELACGEDCLNRLLMIECGPECNVRGRCTNKRFQKLLCSPCRVFRTEKKGFGIMADIEILPGEFIMEYVGEVIDTDEFEKRRIAYSQDKNRHYYFMALRSDAIIDATIKGNISRFINHSCDPNAETQKWTVNGELRIGFFSRKSIMPGEEITFNYQYQRYGREAQRCYCESGNCRGWIGQEPTSDEGEQIDDDEDESDEEDEDEDNSNLLEDDEESDSSVSDPEEVQKKLELAAAQAAAELAPISPIDAAAKRDGKDGKVEPSRSETEEEDSKSKFKKLLSKMAEKVAARHKQTKREQKLQRKKKSKGSSSEVVNKQRSLDDPDIEDEVEFLSRCGLKNQSDTLRLSRLMVRAKLVQTRLNLLEILRKGELPCRRLFLDYHGLRLVHGWMSEDAGNMQIRLALLLTLELLPIPNKTMLTDSKVMQVVRSWYDSKETLSPNDDSLSSNSNSNSQDGALQQNSISRTDINECTNTTPECTQLQKLALKLVSTWENLPEIFRIPKKERIEQMKEHEREADRQYAETEGNRQSPSEIDKSSRFVKRVNTTSTKRFNKPHCSKQLQTPVNLMMRNPTPEHANNISKALRREMFAAKVARDEAEKRMAEERREFDTKCRFFGLDPKKTRPQDVPFCVNPATGQWYSVERKPIPTPPSYSHIQVPEKQRSTNPIDYQLPAACHTLPKQWKYALTPLGQIYYYHVQHRVPQWEPPSYYQLQECEMEEDSGNENTPYTTGPDSSDDDDNVLVGLDTDKLKEHIDKKVEARRLKRYQRLVVEKPISPRREEDRVYNQLEVRKYKENKEKIRKRKEEIRRKRAESLRQSTLNMCTLGSLTDANPSQAKQSETNENSGDTAGVLPIQDYLLSSESDEEEDIKMEVDSPLIDRIVEGDKIVDELDALTTKRPLKRALPPHRDINELPTTSSAAATLPLNTNEKQEYKKRRLEKKEKRKPKDHDVKYRKTKEKFRCDIAGIIVHHLKPYRKDTCTRGRIQSNEDFNHLARKLTHFVMIKELKYCESVGQTLVVTESVKNKSREFIKKYMTKYGEFYVKPSNDPEFKEIPFTL